MSADAPAPERRARWTAVRDAFAPLAGEVRPCAGGVLLAAGPVPLAATDALWLPSPGRLREPPSDAGDDPSGHAWIVPAGPEVAPLAATFGRTAAAAFALDLDTDGTSAASLASGARGAGPRDRAWDGAAEVARRLARAAGAEDAPWREALAVLLATWANEDDDLRLILDEDAPDVASVALDRRDRLIVALNAGGDRLPRRLAAEAAATGREALWARVVPPDDPLAELVRLDPEP